MAPGNNERQPGHTGTIPKTKARNNCNVPQEAVTPTRRDMASNLVSTSLDWVPVSEYNSRSNYNQSRKQTNNTSDQELTDLENSVSFESGFGRFVPVRPQPRALPLNVQNRENLTNDQHDDGASSSVSGHTLHPYAHQMQNGLVPHSNHTNHANHANHAAAAVMIVNPTTPNAMTANMTQPFNAPNQNRKNLTNNLNPTRNNFDGNHSSNNNVTVPVSNSRSGNKTVNLMNNMYDQAQGGLNNVNENNHVHRESARALGEAIVAACPDTAAVERRLGQIREYIRVTSSLVDTMRNSEDEAFIEHTKEEYDELVEMVMKLKESETKLEKVLNEEPDNLEVPAEEADSLAAQSAPGIPATNDTADIVTVITVDEEETCSVKSNKDTGVLCTKNLKKVTNVENEQLNKNLHIVKNVQEVVTLQEASDTGEVITEPAQPILQLIRDTRGPDESDTLEIKEIETIPYDDTENKTHDRHLNEVLRKNIISCVEKVALIEEMKNKTNNSSDIEDQEVVVRPVSAQSNGSAYSENELWQNEIKNKMELSQRRLTALKQQQKRLLKYQEEAKQQLEEMNRDRQSQEALPSTSHDNYGSVQSHPMNGNYNPHRMYAANQIGVATTLPQSSEALHGLNMSSNVDSELVHAAHSNSQDDRFSHRDANIASSEEAAGGARDSDAEEDDSLLTERGRILQMKLRELQLKKQHMENLVSEFQKLQMATTHLGSSNNTYSSSGEDSADEEPSRKCNKTGGNIKNEDPFKLMEIKAIKTALQKTKDLMRSVENYESDHLSGTHDDSFQMPGHSNIHDNKSEGGGSIGGWSNEGSVCRVRNSLPQRHKFTNEQHSQQQLQQHSQQHLQHQQQHLQHQQQHLQHPQQHMQHPQQHLQHPQQHMQQHLQPHQQQHLQPHQQQHLQPHQQQHLQPLQQQIMQPHPQQMGHETNIASLQELAQELRLETEKIVGERARIKDLMTNKESTRKQKKVNEQAAGAWGGAGPAERRQMQLRALLADKQRELDKLLNKEKVLCAAVESQTVKPDSCAASIVNQSYNSEQEEPDSRSEQILLDSQNSRDTDNFRACAQGGDGALGPRSVNTAPSQLGSAYCSDSDSASRTKSNQRTRTRRRQPQDRLSEDNNAPQSNNSSHSLRHEQRIEPSNINSVPPISQNVENPINMPYPHLPPPYWHNNKTNQDMRTNQFTQNSHSQTMERLLGTPQMSFPPSMPFNMMMPYGMVGGCGCGCGMWGAWCWQQLALQQQEIHQLRDQLAHLEERWRAETASHTLNNQVPPGNRANNYWDNFRSYSRQNLLSANSKTSADGHLGVGGSPAAPLAARAHNALRRAPAAPAPPKRNTEPLSLAAPDVLHALAAEPPARNLNLQHVVPEIVQAHFNNLQPARDTDKRKSSSKLPAKNSAPRRNRPGPERAPDPNLASTGRDNGDKAASKLFDLLRENVYSEVTALIGVNESHPDFLIQLFKELQLISSDPLRQRVLQSIRKVLSQYDSLSDDRPNENAPEERPEATVSTTSEPADRRDQPGPSTACSSTMQFDNGIVRFLLMKSDEICTPELLEGLAVQILSANADGRQSQMSKKRLLDFLSKYEGARVCNVSNDIIESLPLAFPGGEVDEASQLASELSEASILQDVAGSLNLFSPSASQLHLNTCPYDLWPAHVHVDVAGAELADPGSPRSGADGKADLINCSEMHDGDLAEADQSRPAEPRARDDAADALPDVVDTEDATPTEAEAEWLGLDRVPTRLHMGESSERQKD